MGEETPVKEKPTVDCEVIPAHIKPLLDCCRDYDQGKIGPDDFFAKALTRTGEFMLEVSKRRQPPSE